MGGVVRGGVVWSRDPAVLNKSWKENHGGRKTTATPARQMMISVRG